jgi:hypothetical protein
MGLRLYHVYVEVVVTRCWFDQKDRVQVLTWLEENIQENYHKDGSRYSMSTISQFVEWRSQDTESWIMRVAGTPPKGYVEIKNEKYAIMFTLKWS